MNDAITNLVVEGLDRVVFTCNGPGQDEHTEQEKIHTKIITKSYRKGELFMTLHSMQDWKATKHATKLELLDNKGNVIIAATMDAQLEFENCVVYVDNVPLVAVELRL